MVLSLKEHREEKRREREREGRGGEIDRQIDR